MNIASINQSKSILEAWKPFFDSVVFPSPNMEIVFDVDFNVFCASDLLFTNLATYNLHVNIGDNLFNDHPFTLEYFSNKKLVSKAIEGETVQYTEKIPIHDRFVYLRMSARPLINKDQVIFGVMVVAKDVTKYEVVSRSLQKREATLRAVIDASDDGIYAIDKKRKVIAINNQAIRDYKNAGYVLKEGDNLNSIIDPETMNRWNKTYFDKVFAGNKLSFRGQLEDADKSKHYVWNKYSPVYINDEIEGCVEVSRSITEIVELENQIRSQLDDLDQKNKALNDYIESNLQLENFAYIASHDLKAPLRSLTSFALLLKSKSYDCLDEKGKKYLDIVIKSSKNMELLINDLLTYGRVNTAKKKFVLLHIQKIVDRLYSDLDVIITESQAEIIINNELPELVGDESMLVQVFENLISNAIKFSKAGVNPEITISCITKANYYEFTIADNGIGISEENHEKVFNIFEKLHSSDIYEGTGLGLTICKKIINLHGGTIMLESIPGQGSTFRFTIQKGLEPSHS